MKTMVSPIWSALLGMSTVPPWRGPRRECHPLDKLPSVKQPNVGQESWEQNRYRGRPPKRWVPWTLLTPGAKLLSPAGVAACWPLLEGRA